MIKLREKVMGKLNLGYFADGKWAHNAFKLLIADEELSLSFICVRFNSVDEVLRELAEQNKIDFIKHENINSVEFLDIVKKYDCDLFVSMSFDQIFKTEIINLPRLKTINIHAGKLPFYRGRNVLNWVLINDETEFGITSHFVDLGIDTGDIILQRTYPINDNDDYSTLLHKAYEECASILYETICYFKNNEVVSIEQYKIHPIGFYCGIRSKGDEYIDWGLSSREIFNFVRAICFPGPKGHSIIDGKIIKINKVSLIEGAPSYKGIPGQIVGKLNSFPVVKTKDSTLLISEYEYEGALRIGDRLNG